MSVRQLAAYRTARVAQCAPITAADADDAAYPAWQVVVASLALLAASVAALIAA